MGAYDHSLLDGEAKSAPVTFQSQYSTKKQHLESMIKNIGHDGGPASPALCKIFKLCPVSPEESIKQNVSKMGESFISNFTTKDNEAVGSNKEFASKALTSVTKLFYYNLGGTIMVETKKLKKGSDNVSANIIQALLENINYQKALFACCLQIVLFSYDKHQKLSWILDVLELDAYYLHKVVEIIMISDVNSNHKLPKETSLYLQSLENQSSDSLVWQSRSPLWSEIKALEDVGKKIPTYEEVKLHGDEKKTSTSQAEQEDLNKEGSKVNGALQIFLRKFYLLSSERLKSLCNKLDLTDEDIQKIWTVFEHCVIHHSESLLMDRHLDQLIMCAIYVVCKATKQEHPAFQTIIHHYRNLPYSSSDVHRDVLLSRTVKEEVEDSVEEKRGDLIKFYCNVFVKHVQEFVRKSIASSSITTALFMSPVPTSTRVQPIESPKIRVPQSPNLLISTLNKNQVTESPGRTVKYVFTGSPVQPLCQISSTVKSGTLMGARKKLSMEDSDATTRGPSPPKKSNIDSSLVNLKVKGLLGDRVNTK